MIEDRVRSISELQGKYIILSKADVVSNIRDLLHFLTDTSLTIRIEENFSHSSSSDVRAWFRSLNIPGKVNVYWITTKEGIQISFEDFVFSYDELWYPSADDIIMSDQGKNWIVKIDHEEIFSFYGSKNIFHSDFV